MGLLSCLGAGGSLSSGGGGFDPANYGSVALWFDASDAQYLMHNVTDPPTDGQSVLEVLDRSGNSRTGLQVTGSQRARWESNQQNSLGALDFDQAANEYYILQNSTGVTNNVPGVTFVSVQQPISTNQYESLCWFSDGTGAERISIYMTDQYNGSYKITLDCKRLDAESVESFASSDVAKNIWRVITIVIDYAAGTWGMYVDGSSVGSGVLQSSGNTSPTNSASPPTWAAYSSGIYQSDGLFGEFIVYNEALGSVDRAAMEAALASKWGL